jgi:hypothetical protein
MHTVLHNLLRPRAPRTGNVPLAPMLPLKAIEDGLISELVDVAINSEHIAAATCCNIASAAQCAITLPFGRRDECPARPRLMAPQGRSTPSGLMPPSEAGLTACHRPDMPRYDLTNRSSCCGEATHLANCLSTALTMTRVQMGARPRPTHMRPRCDITGIKNTLERASVERNGLTAMRTRGRARLLLRSGGRPEKKGGARRRPPGT